MSMPKAYLLQNILSQLMSECDIDDSTLSKQTGIPLSTINRIRNSNKTNPTVATLQPIAKFFKISISQLLGEDPLPVDRLPGTHHPLRFTTSRLPIIKWSWIQNWINHDTIDFEDKLKSWISSEKELSGRSFAIVVTKRSLGLAFRQGTLLIADPKVVYQEGDLVLVKLDKSTEILLKQVIIDGDDSYLRSVNPEIKSLKRVTPECQFIATIVETRYAFRGIDTVLQQKNLVEPVSKLIEEY